MENEFSAVAAKLREREREENTERREREMKMEMKRKYEKYAGYFCSTIKTKTHNQRKVRTFVMAFRMFTMRKKEPIILNWKHFLFWWHILPSQAKWFSFEFGY